MDILERLDRYKGTAFIMDDISDAKREIESLRRRLQNGSPVVEGTIQHMAMEIAALKKERDELVAAAKNLVAVKGRYHTEQAYKMLEATLAKLGADKTGEGS